MLSSLFADNVIVRWLSGRRPQDDLTVAMSGVKLGERVLLVGASNTGLLTGLAAKSGLTGRAVGVTASEAAAVAAATRAERAGVLAEAVAAPGYAPLPLEPASFDLAVVLGHVVGAGPLDAALAETGRCLRAGGRCLLVERATPAASAAAHTPSLARVGAAGFRAGHVLAERDGLVFIEAMRQGN
jgi:SAM-dependent methyltransferase